MGCTTLGHVFLHPVPRDLQLPWEPILYMAMIHPEPFEERREHEAREGHHRFAGRCAGPVAECGTKSGPCGARRTTEQLTQVFERAPGLEHVPEGIPHDRTPEPRLAYQVELGLQSGLYPVALVAKSVFTVPHLCQVLEGFSPCHGSR